MQWQAGQSEAASREVPWAGWPLKKEGWAWDRMNSTEVYKKMAAGREKESFSEMNGSSRWACKGGELSWDQTKMILMRQRVRSCKKAGSFCLVVRPCQLLQYLSGTTRRYRDNILHWIAIKSALDFLFLFLNACWGFWAISQAVGSNLCTNRAVKEGRSPEEGLCLPTNTLTACSDGEEKQAHCLRAGSRQRFSMLSCARPFLWCSGSFWLLLLYASVTNAEIFLSVVLSSCYLLLKTSWAASNPGTSPAGERDSRAPGVVCRNLLSCHLKPGQVLLGPHITHMSPK